ncbi:MAG: TrkH family potassium uptake protein [Actinomycetota bacterium]|jgi:trk system potassium uptake protein|nr:TrkH family potassium uptake protein [Actinomycetota bacterium]
MKKLHATPVRVSGAALLFVSLGMLASAGVALIDGGGGEGALLISAVITAGVGGAMLVGSDVSKRADSSLAFASVAWSWLAVSVAGALPYLFAGIMDWSAADDALFESISGFTCTGSTVIADFSVVPQGVLFFRSLTQWFGGMGLIVLAVAVLPALKVGGLELIASEAPGPTADRLTPRVTETARRLWILYGAVTVILAVALLIVGMSPFDAITHAFTTVATGGYSPRGESAAFFDSIAVEAVLISGMIYCGANFSLHWHAATRGPGAYRRISEVRWYLWMLGGGFVVVVLLNLGELDLGENIRESAFYAVSLGTSTGFGSSDFTLWGPAAQIALVFLMVIGGMSGSTAGGMKVLRLQIMFRYAAREVIRARHPRAVVPMRIGQMVVPEQVAARAIGFILLYLGLILVGGIVVTALGTDAVTGFSGAVSAIGNAGPALGEAGPLSTFLAYPRAARAVLMALMMFGRLELFPTMLMFVAATRAMARAQHERRISLRR